MTVQGVKIFPVSHSGPVSPYTVYTEILEGDIIFCDACDGVVVIPRDLLDAVLDLTPKLTRADEKVMADVKAGGTVCEAFKAHRGG